MPSLTKNREVFNSVANADVVSSNAPNGDVGVSKTVGEKGFFIKSNTTFTLWFKDGSGVWSVSNDNATTGTYEWGANQCFYIQSDSNANFFVFKRKVTPTPRANVVRANKTARNKTFDTATGHASLASSWTSSGHTGEAFSIGMFDSEGAGGYLSAPLSGQREGKILGYDDDGNMGWIIPPVVTVDIMGETDGIENEAALEGGAYFSNTGAVILDGADDYVQTDSNYHYPDQFQVGANIKPTNLDDEFQTIAGTRNYINGPNGFILLIKDGVIRATGPQADNFVLDAPIPDDIDMEDGEFHEIKLKWVKDEELTIFLDGEPIGTHTPTGAVAGGLEDMEIGRNPKNKNMHFEGEIDGVKVTNEVQTEEEILNEFIAKVLGNTPSPVDYDSIEDLESTTMVNGSSLVNGYLTLDGSNYAEADANHHYGDFFMATAWFRTVKHENSWGVICSSRKWNGSGNGFAIAIKNNAIHMHHPQTNNTHIEPTFDHVELSDGEWHQIVLRWKADEDLSGFVDGVKVGSLVPAGGINGGVADLILGTEAHGWTGKFVGHIDGVKVENVYKSDNEIMAEFTKVPLISLVGDDPLSFIDGPYTDPGATAIDHPDGDLTAGITSDWNAVVGASPADGSYTVTYSVADSDGNVSNLERTVQIGDGLEDFATLANNASRPDGALLTNGVSQYGYLPNSTDYDLDGGDMTVRCWFKTDTALGGGRSLMTKGIGGVWKGWGLYLHDQGGLAFNVWSSAGGGGANRSNHMGSPSDWNVGEWNHIALVMRTADTWKLYVNGQLLNEFTPASITTSSDSNLNIGTTQLTNSNSPGYFFDGQIKKALIDKTVLSDAEILAEYQLGEPPEITLLGDNPHLLDSLDDTDPGATANDSLDGDVTANITSNWDDVVIEDLANGAHNVTYSVTDSHGNSRSSTREVWNGTIEDWNTTALHGDASRADGVLTLGGNGYAVADRNHHYDDFFFVESWFKTDSLTPCTNTTNWTGIQMLAGTRKWNGNYNGFLIGLSSTHINIHVPFNNTVYTYDLDGEDINDGEWHYLGLHFSQSPFGGQITLYIDGQGKITESWVGGTPIGGSQNLNIGRNPYGAPYEMLFTGKINHFSILNEHLNGPDVTARYLATKPCTITLLGDSPLNVTAVPATDPGATAEDPTAGDISGQITSDWDAVVGANPDNGSYTVTYSVTSSKGEVITKTRSVEVAVIAIYPDSPFIEEWPFRATPIGTVNEGVIALNGVEAFIDNTHTITIPGSEFAHITDTYTISFWFQKVNQASGVFFQGGGITLNCQHSGGRTLTVNTGLGQSFSKQGTIEPTNGNWLHVAITVSTDDQGNCKGKVYFNGNLHAGLTHLTHTWAKNGDLDWSGDVVLNPEYNLTIDSFEIADYALTQTGVTNLVAAGRGVPMGDVVQSYDPVVYNLTHEPILDGPSSGNFMDSNRSNTDLYAFNRWMNTNHAPLVNPCNDKYTFSVWFKVQDGYGPLVVTHYDAQTTGIWLEVLNDGFKYGTPNGTQTVYDWPVDKNTSFTDGEWHHVVATFDHGAGSRSLYLDGVKMTGGDDTFQALSGNPNNEHLLFYKRWGHPQSYSYQGTAGRYGNLHLLNYVLTDSQVSDIYNAGYRGITIEVTDIPSAPAGYVQDVEDGNGTIVATSNWDAIIGASPAAGNYTVTYSATDSHGGSTDLDVPVVVIEDQTPPPPVVDFENPTHIFDGSSLTASDGTTISTSNNTVVSTNSVTFNGQNVLDYSNSDKEVNVHPAYALVSGVYSFSHWFRNMPEGAFQTFGRIDAGGDSILQVHNGAIRMRQAGTNYYGPNFEAYRDLDTWTHCAIVADGSQSKVYINGQLFHTFNVVADDIVDILGNQPWSQGQQTWANYIADLRYWKDFSLTDADVLALYNASAPPPPPVPLEEQADLHNGATLTDGVLTFDNSSNSYASLPHSEELEVDQQDTTIHLWFYPTSTTFTSGHTQVLVGKHNTGNPNYEGYQIAYGNRKHPTLGPAGETGIKVFSCVGSCGGATHNKIFRVDGGVPLNQWHHIAISYNMATSVHTCYFNGQPIGTWNQYIPNGTTKDFLIGGTGSDHRSLDGKIKGITFEDSVLSDADVLAIYNAG